MDRLDVPEEEAWSESQRLEPFDIGGFSSLEPGRYELVFASNENPPLALSCTIAAQNGDAYRFVAVPEGLAIALEGYEASSLEDVALLVQRLEDVEEQLEKEAQWGTSCSGVAPDFSSVSAIISWSNVDADWSISCAVVTDEE